LRDIMLQIDCLLFCADVQFDINFAEDTTKKYILAAADHTHAVSREFWQCFGNQRIRRWRRAW